MVIETPRKNARATLIHSMIKSGIYVDSCSSANRSNEKAIVPSKRKTKS